MTRISLVLPYYNRKAAADRALAQIVRAYTCARIDLEVLIVDDGSVEPYAAPEWCKVLRLPEHEQPLSPVVPWNRGVEAATGDIIAISCVEVLHTQPVLAQMAEELQRLGPQGYVLAAAWCPEEGRWHCHSEVKVMGCPRGTGRGFLGMMYKAHYLAAGGFDEEYRQGAGYEDIDFIKRLLRAKTQFLIRDDLVVEHPKQNATTQWPAGAFERNRKLFSLKWPAKPLTVCTLQWGNYCGMGAVYVNRLHDMVTRNLTAGFPGRFVCFTDDATGLNEGIIARPLPEDWMQGWDNKIALFKAGVFAPGERVCFIDLDTLITGQLEDIFRYEGEFATLRDFYRPDGLGPAVILWEAGKADWIWDYYLTSDRPRLIQGDQEWLQICRTHGFQMDILQDIYPGAFCSFKAHCDPMPPIGTAVVCFHGHPRPHETRQAWVEHIWKEGGGMGSDLVSMANEALEINLRNVRENCRRGLPRLSPIDAREGTAVLVGGGPGMADCLLELQSRHVAGQTIIAVNGAAQYLAERGLRPDWQIVIDAREHNVGFVRDKPAHAYALSSQCHPSLFDALAGEDVTMIHMNTERIIEAIPKDEQDLHFFGGGSTVGLIAMTVAYALGYRDMHLFGYDSCLRSDAHHAYAQPENDGQDAIDAIVGDRRFKAYGWMVKQVQEFQPLANSLADAGCSITVHGDGLLPHVAHLMQAEIAKQEKQTWNDARRAVVENNL